MSKSTKNVIVVIYPAPEFEANYFR